MAEFEKKPPLRILMTILSLEAGGAQRAASEMAAWWISQGDEVGVVTFKGPQTDHYSLDKRVHRFVIDQWRHAQTPLAKGAGLAFVPLVIRKTVSSFKPDVVISFIDLVNIVMIVSLAGTGIPLVICERTDPRHHPISRTRSLARRILYPLARCLVVQTESVASWARSFVPASKIEVIPNFVRPMPDRKTIENPADFQGPFIIAMGRMDRYKGHDILIRAFAKASEKEQGWKLVILGDGPKRQDLVRLAEDLGVGRQVFMPGIVKEPAGWLYSADIFVHPSLYEGFPNALLEAMACGCASIASDCPSGPREIIQHGINGLLVVPNDPDSLVRAMLSLMRDDALRRRLSREARRISYFYSPFRIMGVWDSLLGEIIHRNR